VGIWENVAVLFLIYSVYAASLTVIIGYAGILAVAPTAFGAAGGYVTAWLAVREGVNSYVALVASLVVVAVVALVLSIVVLRLEPVFVILITVALATIVVGTLPKVTALGGPYGISGVRSPHIFGLAFDGPLDFIVPAGILALAAYGVSRFLGESPVGLILKASREESTAVKACGIDPVPSKVLAFVISAVLCAAAGAMTAIYNGVVVPAGFSFDAGMLIVAVAIIGGIARPAGAVIGALFIQVIPEVLEQTMRMDPSRAFLIQQLVFGCALVAVMILRPSGILLEKPSRFIRRSGSAAAAEPVARPRSRSDHTVGSVVLRADGLSKSFGGVVATNGFSFALGDGKIVGLIGPNGAGKTTLFNLLTGTLQKDAGTVELFGQSITRSSTSEIAGRGLARSFQDVRLWPDLTALENVFLAAYGAERRETGRWRAVVDRRRVVARALVAARAALERVGLGDKAMTTAGGLSHGEQKLVAFARLLAADTSVLLLDEPTAGVGPDVSQRILGLVKDLGAEGRSILIVEHNLDVMREVAQWCYFMDQGVVVREGTYADLASDPVLVASYFGTGHKDAPAGMTPVAPAEANS